VAGLAHLARPVAVGEHQLVDDDVVRVDAALGQLLDQPLRLVQGQELGDTHADEGGLLLHPARRNGKWSNGLHLYSAFIQSAFRVASHPPIHTVTAVSTMQGNNQHVRSS